MHRSPREACAARRAPRRRRRRASRPSGRRRPGAGEQVGGLRRPRPACGGPGRAGSPTPRARRRRRARRPAAAAARCSVAASCGAVSAARRTSTDSTGLALCGIVDEPPPRRPRPARRSRGATSSARRWRSAPQASVQPTSASPSRVTGARVVCHGRGSSPSRRRSRPSSHDRGAGSPAAAAASVPAAPPNWRQVAAEVVVRVEHRRQPGGDPEAEGGRDRVLGERARDHRGVAVRARRARRAARRPVQVAAQVGARPPQAISISADVDDVLAGQPAVQPPAGRRSARAAGRPAG